MIKNKLKTRKILLTQRNFLLSEIDKLSNEFNATNDWRKREVIKQQIFAIGQELNNVGGR